MAKNKKLLNKMLWCSVFFTVFVSLIGCAANSAVGKMQKRSEMIAVGKTNKQQVEKMLGSPSEKIIDGNREIFIYSDKLEIPLFVSFIPVVGDITDGVEMVHKNHELIVQFDENSIVRKYKVRDTD